MDARDASGNASSFGRCNKKVYTEFKYIVPDLFSIEYVVLSDIDIVEKNRMQKNRMQKNKMMLSCNSFL